MEIQGMRLVKVYNFDLLDLNNLTEDAVLDMAEDVYLLSDFAKEWEGVTMWLLKNMNWNVADAAMYFLIDSKGNVTYPRW